MRRWYICTPREAGTTKPNVPVGARHNASVKVMTEYATRSNTWLMRILLMANFEEDYNVETTTIDRAGYLQQSIRYNVCSRTERENGAIVS